MDGRQRTQSGPARRTTPDAPDPRPGPDRPTVYEVRVRGHLDDHWAGLGDELSVGREESGDTLLTVPVMDQAGLHGLLRSLRDLGATLISITPAGADLPDVSARMEKER